MRGEEDDDLAPLGRVRPVLLQLLPDVLGEGGDQLGVGGPPVDHAPLHLALNAERK